MEYIIVTVSLFLLMLVYFKIAGRFNIIDKPNHRSAHSEVTIRGGGIVFPVAFLLFLIADVWGNVACFPLPDVDAGNQNYIIFGTGLLLICVISFIDDIINLSSKIRIVFHIAAVTFLLFFLTAFGQFPIWGIAMLYILIIGTLNAYNFMDGINGMTGLYSLAVLFSLLLVNEEVAHFTQTDFIIYPILASLVFLFFNFRKKARCFMGDIGSMGIAFWVIALLGLLMMKTGELKWMLFLSVYGVEVIATILERLKLKENIFEAHRRHLYQLFANERKVSHLVVSTFYAAVQLIINIIVISADMSETLIFAVILIPSVIFYFYIKFSAKKSILINS